MSEKYTVFRSKDDGELYCVRNVEPRFTVKYVPSDNVINISFENSQDELPLDPIKVAKLMRGIGEEIARFLQFERKNNANEK